MNDPEVHPDCDECGELEDELADARSQNNSEWVDDVEIKWHDHNRAEHPD